MNFLSGLVIIFAGRIIASSYVLKSSIHVHAVKEKGKSKIKLFANVGSTPFMCALGRHLKRPRVMCKMRNY